ncbi:hypothetical protein PSMK_06280 [Phycisphaera mikurensis NBRC 102666]|uniref:VWFA domain-containing protein n=2 Tax=Phycisphaera TaxID=666508 RepID=I0IBZ9_PHYMF|nr:hypothetical protein PSMK_06280 [Phycisphaera mikurensis NBRC 102666]
MAALLAAAVLAPATTASAAEPDASEGWPYVAPPPPPPPPPTPEEIAERERRQAEAAERRRLEEEERRRNPPPPAPPMEPVAPPPPPPPNTAVDIELALLVDASKSVDDREWELQIDGYVKAFEDPAVQAQIMRSDGVAVMFMTWSSTWQHSNSGWHDLRTAADCRRFAQRIANFERRHADNTIMSNALGTAMHFMKRNKFDGRREVIDVSGDGVCENQAYYAANERGDDHDLDRLMGPTWDFILGNRGPNVTINGISIGDVEGLAGWYADELAQGPNSFSMHAADFEEFAIGIREKLVRELEPTAYD